MENEKAELILNAIGTAVVELVVAQVPIIKDNLLDRLEYNLKNTGNMLEKEANRDAVELVSQGE